MSLNSEELIEEINLEPSCYCGKPRTVLECEFYCNRCHKFFHIKCLKLPNKTYLSKALLTTNYFFMCAECSSRKIEIYRQNHKPFVYNVISAMAQLTARTANHSFDSGFTRTLTIPQRGSIFLTIHNIANHIAKNPFLHGKKKNFTQIVNDINKCINRYPNIFKVSPNFKTSFALSIGLDVLCSDYKAEVNKVEKKDDNDIIALKVIKRERDYNSRSRFSQKKVDPCPPEAVPFNSELKLFYGAEYDPHSKFIEDNYKKNLFSSYYYRRTVPDRITLSLHNKSKDLSISDDALQVQGFGGYRTVKATHSVRYGKWYFEAKINRCPPESCIRLGWSQPTAPLDAALGYSKFSYAVRSKKGTKFHNACGYRYFPRGFKPGDTIGLLIDLPAESINTQEYEGSKKACTVAGNVFKFMKEEIILHSKVPIDSMHIHFGSKIEYFLNGESCGVAYENIYSGFYYPSISLYGYDGNGPEVAVNFGPQVEYLPDGAKTMSSRVDEMACEIAMSDILDLIYAHMEIIDPNQQNKEESDVYIKEEEPDTYE